MSSSWPQDPLKIFLAEDLKKLLNPLLEGVLESEKASWLRGSFLASSLERPKERDYGDYALPCFRFSVLLRTSPASIASSVEQLWQEMDEEEKDFSWISEVQALKGFVNITLRSQSLCDFVLSTLLAAIPRSHHAPTLGFDVALVCEKFFKDSPSFPSLSAQSKKPEVMIEFSQPNTHKEFHIGHARNVCLGSALCSLYDYAGSQVIAVNYIGDEGTHVAKALWHIATEGLCEPPPGVSAGTWCNDHYVKATRKLEAADEKSTEVYVREISHVLSQLEAGEGAYYDLWLTTKEQCMQDFYKIYEWLNISFDHYYYESELTAEAQELVDDYLEKGVFQRSEGAVGLDLREQDLGFMMARKSDGHSLYITKDLALAQRKSREFPALERSLYVVGDEQNFHFQQLFASLKVMGLDSGDLCFHVSYGMVVLKEGKMSSRKGNTVGFWQLVKIIEEALQKPLEKYQDSWSEKQWADTLKLLVEGTIKFGMLSQDPHKELVFDREAWTSFEGKSGPYLMYAYARGRNVLRKAGWCVESSPSVVAQQNKSLWCLESPEERWLLLSLCASHEFISKAKTKHQPSVLCHYLFDLAKDFSKFYAACPILSGEDTKLKDQRLALTDAFVRTLKQGLGILGITPPEVM